MQAQSGGRICRLRGYRLAARLRHGNLLRELSDMELPPRARGDELLKPGELAGILLRLRSVAAKHDLASVIVCAFDHRTRMLPFLFADTRMAPAGVRAIGSAMVDAGFDKTRIVLQQWNRNFRPSRMRLDGRIPDLFMVSSMQIHSGQCEALIRDACRIAPAARPLIIAGGPKVIYEPWDVFGVDPADPWGADVAVTGEEYVLLNLLDNAWKYSADPRHVVLCCRRRDGRASALTHPPHHRPGTPPRQRPSHLAGRCGRPSRAGRRLVRDLRLRARQRGRGHESGRRRGIPRHPAEGGRTRTSPRGARRPDPDDVDRGG
ncbi:hypothetical protein LCGC14_2083230, partial [marine sediment metagenome]